MVIHYTAMASAEAALDRLCDPAAEVSAHWLVGADGAVWTLVPEDRRAWHAGAGAWGAVTDVNSASIGVELDHPGFGPFPEAQMRALEALLDGIMARWGIPPEGVIGHSDMAPGRKRDPGPRFDWFRLARGGRAVWPPGDRVGPGGGGAPDPLHGSGSAAAPAPPRGGAAAPAADPARFHRAARRFGYPTGGIACHVLLRAFRMRFRPCAAGGLQAADIRLAEALAARWPGPGMAEAD